MNSLYYRFLQSAPAKISLCSQDSPRYTAILETPFPLKCIVGYKLLIISSDGGSNLREIETPVILSRYLRQDGKAQMLCSCLQPSPLRKY